MILHYARNDWGEPPLAHLGHDRECAKSGARSPICVR
jgi:hypothetical protein